MASPHANRDTPGRDRSPRTVTAAEKAQAREVSLRRIGRLFRPYRMQLAAVTAIIVASSLVGLASPFLLRAVIDTALPDRNLRLLAWLVIAMVAVAGFAFRSRCSRSSAQSMPSCSASFGCRHSGSSAAPFATF